MHLQADQSVVLTLEPCLKASQKPIFQCLKMEDGRKPEWFNAQSVKLHGEHLTLNIGEYPNEERESSLSQILQQPTDVPEKYYLSSRACQGILNRAEKRGKELPAPLKKALEQQANLSTGGGTSVVKIRSGRDDGTAGKGALIGIEQSFTLGTGNDQTLFQERKDDTVRTKNGIITYNIHKTVKVRKHEVDMDGLKTLLKDSLKSSGLSKKDIAEKLNVPQTQVDHYFRQDKYFSIPDAEIWLTLKEMLGIITDEFDEQIMEFEEKECNFDSANRIYDDKM